MRPRVVICGSFHRQPDGLRRLFRELEATGCRVLSPISLDFIDPASAFVTTNSETDLSAADIERFHLRAIRDADFLVVHAPSGHIGTSAVYELGFASALNKPAFAFEKPEDTMLATRVKQIRSVFEIIDELQLDCF